MRNLFIIIAAAAAAALASCGGEEEITPSAQCVGTPRAAVVYVGKAHFPELAGIHDACVYSTAANSIAELDLVVDRALRESGRRRVYFISAFTGLPLAWRAARPGLGEITSLWFPPEGTSGAGIVGSLSTVHVNDTAEGAAACNALAARLKADGTPAACQLWPADGFNAEQRAAAIEQLQLHVLP